MSARPATAPPGQAARHYLGHRRNVWHDPKPALRAAPRHTEAADHLVHDHDDAVLRRDLPDALEEARIGHGELPPVPARRLHYHGRNVVVSLEQLPEGVHLRLDDDDCRHRLLRDAHLRVDPRLHGDVVVPAVEVLAELHQLLPAREAARQAERQQRRFGPRGGEPHPLGAGDQVLHQPGPLDLQLGRGAHVGALGQPARDRFRDLRVGVAEHQGPEPHHVVDQLVAVDVPLRAPAALFHEQGEGLDYPRLVAAARDQPRGTFVRLPRPPELLLVPLQNGSHGRTSPVRVALIRAA